MTLTANEHEAGFWQASAQEQLTVVVPSGNGSLRGLPSLRAHVDTMDPLQLSSAVGGVMLTGSPNFASIFPGQARTGAIVSCTVIICVQLA